MKTKLVQFNKSQYDSFAVKPECQLRNGTPVRVLCTDWPGQSEQPVCVMNVKGGITSYGNDGTFYIDKQKHPLDLFMLVPCETPAPRKNRFVELLKLADEKVKISLPT